MRARTRYKRNGGKLPLCGRHAEMAENCDLRNAHVDPQRVTATATADALLVFIDYHVETEKYMKRCDLIVTRSPSLLVDRRFRCFPWPSS